CSRRSAGSWAAAARTGAAGRTAKATERAKPPHLVVLLSLLGVAQYLIRLRDLLEGLGGFRVVRILIRVMLRGELAVLLFDLVLRCGRGNAEDRVEVLRLGHGSQYVLSRSTASRQRGRGAAAGH